MTVNPVSALAQRIDIMPIIDHTGRVVERLNQLATCLEQAVRLAEETIEEVTANLEVTRPRSRSFSTPEKRQLADNQDSCGLPIVDRRTFAIHWRGKTCYLGNTLPYKFFERLARRPNQLIPCDELLDDVWQGLRSREAIRSVVKVLRQKLGQAGMDVLARSIDGRTPHHYGLMLNGSL
jgi:hypothetical protein